MYAPKISRLYASFAKYKLFGIFTKFNFAVYERHIIPFMLKTRPVGIRAEKTHIIEICIYAYNLLFTCEYSKGTNRIVKYFEAQLRWSFVRLSVNFNVWFKNSLKSFGSTITYALIVHTWINGEI